MYDNNMHGERKKMENYDLGNQVRQEGQDRAK